MRTLTVIIIFLAIFAAFSAPALGAGKGIWENTRCAADSDAGGPTRPCDFCDALQVTANIVDYLLTFATVAATIMIVVGALIMMFAAGSEERFATGKKTVLNAVIGMAIALVSWLVVSEVLHFLSGKANLPWNQINCA